MKYRLGFVSNSSSSIFVVIGKEPPERPRGYTDEYLVIPDNLNNKPCFRFGWENTEYDTFEDRLCFAIIQAGYEEGWVHDSEGIDNSKPKWQLILKSLQEMLGIKGFINHLASSTNDDKYWAYIDHQSAATEGCNTDMFNSLNDMTFFLFSKDSVINGGNDND